MQQHELAPRRPAALDGLPLERGRHRVSLSVGDDEQAIRVRETAVGPGGPGGVGNVHHRAMTDLLLAQPAGDGDVEWMVRPRLARSGAPEGAIESCGGEM